MELGCRQSHATFRMVSAATHEVARSPPPPSVVVACTPYLTLVLRSVPIHMGGLARREPARSRWQFGACAKAVLITVAQCVTVTVHPQPDDPYSTRPGIAIWADSVSCPCHDDTAFFFFDLSSSEVGRLPRPLLHCLVPPAGRRMFFVGLTRSSQGEPNGTVVMHWDRCRSMLRRPANSCFPQFRYKQ